MITLDRKGVLRAYFNFLESLPYLGGRELAPIQWQLHPDTVEELCRRNAMDPGSNDTRLACHTIHCDTSIPFGVLKIAFVREYNTQPGDKKP